MSKLSSCLGRPQLDNRDNIQTKLEDIWDPSGTRPDLSGTRPDLSGTRPDLSRPVRPDSVQMITQAMPRLSLSNA